MEKNIVIVGDSSLAEIAFEYFTYDSPYKPVAFSVEREYLKQEQLFDLPVVAFEDFAGSLPARGSRGFCRNHISADKSVTNEIGRSCQKKRL